MKILALLILLQYQPQIDSMQSLLQSAQKDTNKVKLLMDLSWSYRNSVPQKAIEYGEAAYRLAMRLQYRKGITQSLTFIGVAYRNLGNYKQAMLCFEQVMQLASKYDDYERIAYTYLNIGYLYTLQGNYPVALEHLLSGTKMAERMKNYQLMGYCYVNIARVFVEQKSYSDALPYHMKALGIRKRLNDDYGAAVSMNEIGLTLLNLGKTSAAKDYLHQALRVVEGLKQQVDIAVNNKDMGVVYTAEKNLDSAFFHYKKALAIYQKAGDQNGVADVCNLLASNFFTKLNIDSALYYAHKSLRLSTAINALSTAADASGTLSNVYEKIQRYDKAFEYQKKYKTLSDTLLNIKNTQRILRLEMQYRFEKERIEQEIKHLKQESEIRTELDRQKMYRNVFIVGGIVLFLFLMLVWYHYTVKRRANKLLEIQNAEIQRQNTEIQKQAEYLLKANNDILSKNLELEMQKEEILTQAEYLQDANNEITSQKEIIAQKNDEIMSSIVYAQRIQHAILPATEMLDELLGSYFVFYKPKDIIGGDFYWVKKIKKYILLAVADCTGHGVPGAMMSMLGFSSLNEIIRRHPITEASKILDELRVQIKYSLQQTGKDNEAKDGMDIALCIIDTQTGVLQFAGANNSVMIVRTDAQQGVEVIELKSDRMPIGVYYNETPFMNQIIQLQPDDNIYLYSDGFADQFGTNGKKFKRQGIKTLLSSVHKLPMYEQRRIVQHTFDQWRGNCEQVDDVLFLGFKHTFYRLE